MAHIRMLVSIAGHGIPEFDLPDFSFAPGDEIDLHDELAQKWVESGIAEVAKPKAPRKVKNAPKPAVSDAGTEKSSGDDQNAGDWTQSGDGLGYPGDNAEADAQEASA